MTRRPRPLALETLEGRSCPAVDAFVTANAVVLIGTQGATGDTVDLDWGTGGQLTVTYSTASGNQTVNFTDKTQAVVKLAGLSDTVSVRVSANQTKRIKVTTELGGGDDSFEFGVKQGQGVAIQSDVRLNVKGGAGDDRVVLQDSPDVSGASFLVQTSLGSGDDTFVGSVGGLFLRFAFPLPRASFLVDGGIGDDNIEVLAGSTGLDNLGPASALTVLVRGGAGDDFINADCMYDRNGTGATVRVLLDGEAGDDVLVADLEQTSFPDRLVPFYSAVVRGGSGNDVLSLSVRGHPRAGVLDGGTGIDIGFGENTTAVLGCEFV